MIQPGLAALIRGIKASKVRKFSLSNRGRVSPMTTNVKFVAAIAPVANQIITAGTTAFFMSTTEAFITAMAHSEVGERPSSGAAIHLETCALRFS